MSLKGLSGAGCGTPSLHELVSTLLYSAWKDVFTVEDILHQQVTLSLNEDMLLGEANAL